MMASELIAALQALIAEHGDQKIWVSDSPSDPEVMFEDFDADFDVDVPDIGCRIHILGR